ncbi:3-dehydroquinate synthase [Staphylococcus sp. SQ8-PEA]|uniref:3-dehydroquinate synthase n=1 Tax=Staphylococcus marylandisciuri TaxID=2981529 RepID=A0ABT2QND3_9STAP|nr:3-dehydroquinate synthase [Staphylococcus marylandisciuri]MCU5745485.1 3-dehydroquinate synthase [Staphylococcus marylandisciuri]
MFLETTYNSNNYPIYIESGAIDKIEDIVSNHDKVILLVDAQIFKIWKDKILSLSTKIDGVIKTVPSGESTKTLYYYEQTIEELLEYKLTRNTCLVAVGGGATGDFTGFIASTLLRGVDFIQIPTTILAHDSSVGGKVGINSQHGKNLIGAFYRPKAVLYDLDFLRSLPYSEILSGYTEVYKHALLSNNDFKHDLEEAYPDQKCLQSMKRIEEFLHRGIQTKLNIIVADEKERNLRKFLNLGHTLGHAIEYRYKIPHGHAVAIGIIYQFIVSNISINANFDVKSYITYFNELGYPVSLINSFNFEELYQLMLLDKKNTAAGTKMVLLKSIGEPVIRDISKREHKLAFKQLKEYILK